MARGREKPNENPKAASLGHWEHDTIAYIKAGTMGSKRSGAAQTGSLLSTDEASENIFTGHKKCRS